MNHGIRATYACGCRCPDCTAANSVYVKRYKFLARPDYKTGVPSNPLRTPSGPVADHIDRLIRSGWTVSAIAAEAGLGRTHVSNIKGRYFRSLRRDFAAAILAIQPLEPVDHDPVVVDRLVAMYPNGTWRDVGGREATIAERHAALQRLDTRAQRAALRRLGYGDQQIDLPSYDDVRKWLGLGTHTLQRLAREAS